MTISAAQYRARPHPTLNRNPTIFVDASLAEGASKMKRAAFLFGVMAATLIVQRAGAFDQNAAQAACGNDVFALCQQYIPDHNRIAACLRAHQTQVSGTCRQFMANYAAQMRRTARHAGRETVGSAPTN
jgi:hypothetical protein